MAVNRVIINNNTQAKSNNRGLLNAKYFYFSDYSCHDKNIHCKMTLFLDSMWPTHENSGYCSKMTTHSLNGVELELNMKTMKYLVGIQNNYEGMY